MTKDSRATHMGKKPRFRTHKCNLCGRIIEAEREGIAEVQAITGRRG